MSFVQNMNATQQAPAKQEPRILELLRDKRTADNMKALATEYMQPERMLSLAIQCLNRTPKLKECNVASFLGALAASFALGLEPNTPLGHAYLIPYSRNVKLPSGKWEKTVDCQFQIGYKGFVALLERTGVPSYHFASSVRENDTFRHDMMNPQASFFQKSMTKRGELVGAVFYMIRQGGGNALHVMELEEIVKIRSCSETYRTLTNYLNEAKAGGDQKAIVRAQENLNKTPWVMWEDEMVAKSVLKRAVKMMDLQGTRIKLAAALDDVTDYGRADMAKVGSVSGVDDTFAALEEVASVRVIADDGQAPIDVSEEPEAQEAAHPWDSALQAIREAKDEAEIDARHQSAMTYAKASGAPSKAAEAEKAMQEAKAGLQGAKKGKAA